MTRRGTITGMQTWLSVWIKPACAAPCRRAAGRVLFVAGLLAGAAPGAYASADDGDQAAGQRWERPGLVADRATRTLRVDAFSTDVTAREPMEFFLIHEKSGHDYEAFAVTPVPPGEIHRGLEFIGLAPGRHVDPDRLRFWPRGPRVTVRVEEPVDGADAPIRYPAEDTVLDTRTATALPRTGFVFAGSIFLHEDERLEGDGYAADVMEPHAIVTFFNQPMTVLDVPRRAFQSEVYAVQVRHPDRVLAAGAPLTVVFEPAELPHPDGFDLDIDLTATGGEDGLRFRLRAEGEEILDDGPASAVDAWLSARREEGRDVWCRLEKDGALTLLELSAVAEVVDRWVDTRDLRVEPPEDGRFFHQAFRPNPAFRERETRPAQPWELHLYRRDGEWRGRMVRHVRDYTASLETGERVFSETIETEAPDRDRFRETLDEDPGPVTVLLVFAPTDMTLDEITHWVRGAMTTHPVIFVFTSDE